MTGLAAEAGALIDLTRVAFTAPGSRLLVMAGPDGWLRVSTSQYERWFDDCLLLSRLGVVDADGRRLPVTSVLPHRIEFGGRAALCLAGETLSLGGEPGLELVYRTSAGASGRAPLGGGCLLAWPGEELVVTPDPAHAAALSRAEAQWDDWFARCPRVRADLQPMAALCWWVLGANTLRLSTTGDARAVVPSRLGYVALWQWDSYFIAVGLRHGDPALAREQLSLVLRFPGPDGQLPDVVHDFGVLASSEDLPAADVARLHEVGSTAEGVRVPLTKPPLTAWAIRKVLEVEPDETWLASVLPTVLASQDWWFAASDSDGDGLPEYAHPYSSGLDDSPVFDGPLPVATPELAAYLVKQDELLAGLLAGGDPVAAARCAERAERTLGLLLESWDAEAGVFRAKAAGERVPADTVLGLLPLFTGRLPTELVERILATLDDPDRYATRWPVPTVSAADPAFDPDRMWRGPVWLCINRLLIEGLAASGQPERARELTERTLA
ncbi:MAG: hypothetical protein KIT69_16730, partial [Propionibacteriaceae bacterium]|nr:hypothetical protein [Propionibacteriaceae bacterium]